jgi:hypothetical protein
MVGLEAQPQSAGLCRSRILDLLRLEAAPNQSSTLIMLAANTVFVFGTSKLELRLKTWGQRNIALAG